MPAYSLLGKDQLAIDPNIKHATGSWDQFPAFGEILKFAFFQDFVRQTDGNRGMVSSGAVFDDDIHSSVLHVARSCLATHFDR